MKSIGEQLKSERKIRGISQLQASIQIGLSITMIGQIEAGRKPGPVSVGKIEKWISSK